MRCICGHPDCEMKGAVGIWQCITCGRKFHRFKGEGAMFGDGRSLDALHFEPDPANPWHRGLEMDLCDGELRIVKMGVNGDGL